MNKKYLLVFILALTTAFSVVAVGQSSGGVFTITKSTIDAGGGVSAGGAFKVTGTIGQADASNGAMVGGSFRLAGGFWANAAAGVFADQLFKDSFEGN